MTVISRIPVYRRAIPSVILLVAGGLLALAGCGGSGSAPGDSSAPPPLAATCVPGDSSTAAECGTLLLGITDAEGDFLSYGVDVEQLTLRKADGGTVSVLPARTRVDFAEYVDLTEFVSAVSIPPGVYVGGSITIDYSDAEIFVEAGDSAKEAVVVDGLGEPVVRAELRMQFADRDRLSLQRGQVAFMAIDFDLDASHIVDIEATPATATSEPFIVAELVPLDNKDIRVRGSLVSASPDGMFYTVALRPFYDRLGDFGRLRVNVTETTDFEVDGESSVGASGLRALAAEGEGTLTVAAGTLDPAQREFTARRVVAGTSVPGNGLDAVKGNVLSRSGDQFVVRGGTVILTDSDRAFFHDDVSVTIGPDTKVYRTLDTDRPLGMPVRLLDTSAVSVGQAVTVRGEAVVSDGPGIHINATHGSVALHPTHLLGKVNGILPGQVDILLHSIDRRRADAFDFSGTGIGSEFDADPQNYEVATGTLLMPSDAADLPVVVYGFPTGFGSAPPDFVGRTFILPADVHATLGVAWGAEGTSAPFLMMDGSGLLVDNANPDIGGRHHVKYGPFLFDLTALDSNTLVVPRESDRALFVIKTTDSLQQYADFSDFLLALATELGSGKARSMFARGHYDRAGNRFTAFKIYVYVTEP